MADLADKVALVTGAGSGIGRAVSIRLAQDGAKLALTDLNGEEVEKTRKEVRRYSPESIALKMDVTSEGEIEKTVEAILKVFSTMDILVNNAGVSTMGRFYELTTEEWDYNMDVNAKGTWLVTKHVAPILMEKKSGKIIMVASMASKLGAPLLAHYSASKFAVLGFVQAVARELAPYNINVNAVCPGFVQTPMQDREVVWEAELRGISSPETVRREYVAATPLGRLCQPLDVARVVSFLASEDADFMTGQGLNVTGGTCVH
jgi:NAD(P)-dependent dehydrogenase (short-subunit alcohol dehydrogenase family)